MRLHSDCLVTRVWAVVWRPGTLNTTFAAIITQWQPGAPRKPADSFRGAAATDLPLSANQLHGLLTASRSIWSRQLHAGERIGSMQRNGSSGFTDPRCKKSFAVRRVPAIARACCPWLGLRRARELLRRRSFCPHPRRRSLLRRCACRLRYDPLDEPEIGRWYSHFLRPFGWMGRGATWCPLGGL